MCVCFLFFQAMVLNPKRPVGLSEETKGKFNSAVSNWTQKSQQLRLVICLLLYTVPWENELGTCQWISRILQLRINDGQSSPHRSLLYSITSPARQHISKALSLFEDNKLIPRQINAFHLHIPVEVLTRGACLNYCDTVLFNAFQRGMGSFRALFFKSA